jgi:hypothetical protein
MVGLTSFPNLWPDHLRQARLTQGNFALQQMADCRAYLVIARKIGRLSLGQEVDQ